MRLTPQITIAAAILALNSGGWVRNTALSMGCVSGAIACFQHRPRSQAGLTDSEVMELAIASSLKQTEDEVNSLEKLLADKTKELAELDHLTNEELEKLSQEKRDQVQNLNRQVEDLQALLDEQLAEIDKRESDSRKQLTLEIEQHRAAVEAELTAREEQLTLEISQYKAAIEAELAAKQQQLSSLAQDDEAWLALETERLTQALEADKAAFLEKHQQECVSLRREADRLLDEIDLLKSELNAAYKLLEKYEEPELPRGFDTEKVVAYKLQMFWRNKGIITHLISAYPDEANRRVLVRLRPKIGGQKQFKKEWLNELQVQEDLPEPVGIQTVAGAIEFEIKPRTWTAFKPWNDSPPPPPGQREAITYQFENPSPVTQEELQNFQPPIFRFDPRGAIGRLEQTWIISLWESGVRNQGVICSTVYRSRTGNPVSKGDGSSFINARERMYSILDMQNITYIRRGA